MKALQRCVACRARLEDGDAVCPRCGCDYRLALEAAAAAESLLGQAVKMWCSGRKAEAASLAARANQLSGHRLARFLAGQRLTS